MLSLQCSSSCTSFRSHRRPSGMCPPDPPNSLASFESLPGCHLTDLTSVHPLQSSSLCPSAPWIPHLPCFPLSSSPFEPSSFFICLLSNSPSQNRSSLKVGKGFCLFFQPLRCAVPSKGSGTLEHSAFANQASMGRCQHFTTSLLLLQ